MSPTSVTHSKLQIGELKGRILKGDCGDEQKDSTPYKSSIQLMMVGDRGRIGVDNPNNRCRLRDAASLNSNNEHTESPVSWIGIKIGFWVEK